LVGCYEGDVFGWFGLDKVLYEVVYEVGNCFLWLFILLVVVEWLLVFELMFFIVKEWYCMSDFEVIFLVEVFIWLVMMYILGKVGFY